MTQIEKVKRTAKVLKKRYPTLSNEECIHVAYLILEALDAPPDKVTNNDTK